RMVMVRWTRQQGMSPATCTSFTSADNRCQKPLVVAPLSATVENVSRRVGPERAGQFGLLAHVEVTGARNAMGAAGHFDEAPSGNSMTRLSVCGSGRLTSECP